MTQPTKREQLAAMRLEEFKVHLRTSTQSRCNHLAKLDCMVVSVVQTIVPSDPDPGSIGAFDGQHSLIHCLYLGL
jgi:hypothetical protein